MVLDDAVVDTTIVLHYVRGSEIAKQIEADCGLLRSGFRPFLSVVTLGEMEAFASNWGTPKREKLQALLSEFVAVEVGRPEVISAYAILHGLNRGVNVGHNDLWIAATANALKLPLITTDLDFRRLPPGAVRLITLDAQTGKKLP